MTRPQDTTPANPAQGVNEARLPATKAYVDRLIRIFNERPTDDTSAVVLVDYARAAITAAIGAGGQAVDQGLRDAAKAMGAEVARSVPVVGSQPHPADKRAVEALRENLRRTMLEQPTSGRRETFTDGYHQGLCRALELIDAASHMPVGDGSWALRVVERHRQAYIAERDDLIGRGKANAALYVNLIAACDSITNGLLAASTGEAGR